MMKKIVAYYFIILSSVVGIQGYSQGINEYRLKRMRDSLDIILMVNPGASAILVKRQEMEFYSNNTFLSSSQFNDKQGNNSNLQGKSVLFNSLFQINYGISKRRRVNVGIDLSYRAFRYDLDESASAFSVFESDPNTVRSFTYLGPRVRIQPFRKVKNFTYQSNVWLPIAASSSQEALGTTRIHWGNTFFYYKYLTNRIGIFAQANVSVGLPTKGSGDNATTELLVPVSFSVSYVATRKNIFYSSLSYGWINADITNVIEGADSDFSQFTLGYQRIINRRFYATISYNGTIFSRNYGEWNGFNFGFRYLY